MHIYVPRETRLGEKRIPLIPPDVVLMIQKGAKITIETNMGQSAGYDDSAYLAVGAAVASDGNRALAEATMVLRLNKPPLEAVDLLSAGSIHISYLDPFNEPVLIKDLAERGVSALSMELIPRTTIAQKMDALSSQASLGGYAAIILAAERVDKVFPMMTTPAGTISPLRVFVIGAGVAGLQAIATAKRLGARVEAFDTRPVAAEQVRSVGAKFVALDLGETGQTQAGYAQQLTDEQLEKQRQALAKHCALADVIITTAQVFGRRAPLIVTEDMVAQMKSGSVIVDMAVETGGNVAGSISNEEVVLNGVRIIGLGNLPGQVAVHASQMYSSNLRNLVEHLWDDETQTCVLNLEDEIVQSCLVTHNYVIYNEGLVQHYAMKPSN